MRILVFIGSDLYVRNYVRTSVFGDLAGHDVHYVLDERVQLQSDVRRHGNVVGVVKATRLNRWLYRISSVLQMYDRGRINRNFAFRLERDYAKVILYRRFGLPFGSLSLGSPLRRRINAAFGSTTMSGRFLVWAAGRLKAMQVYAGAIPGLAQYALIVAVNKARLTGPLRHIALNWFPINSGIKRCLLSVDPDLVVIPSSVVEPIAYEFIRATKRLSSATTLVLIDNWDNLSSKSAFIENPDHLAVWGKQSAEFASAYQRLSPGQVRVIGSPRFEVYWDFLNGRAGEQGANSTKIVDHPYILFGGCAVGFDEIGALKATNDVLKANEASFPAGTKILYRPHPWGPLDAYLVQLETANLTYVVIDPQVRDRKQSEAGSAFQPALDYYPALLQGASCVVCPLSTLVIEATIMGKPVIALAHDDGVSLLAPKRILDNYVHFRGLERLRNITIVRDLDQLGSAMLRAVTGPVEIDASEVEYFVASSRITPYRERLAQFIDSIDSDRISPTQPVAAFAPDTAMRSDVIGHTS